MKKRFILILLSFITLCSGCSNIAINNEWKVADGITIKLAQDSYPPGVKKMTVTLENDTDFYVGYEVYYYFEKKVGFHWVRVDEKQDYGFADTLSLLPAHGTRTFIATTAILKQDLNAGLYRVVGSSTYVNSNQYHLTDGMKYPPFLLEFRVSPDAENEQEFK